MTVKEIHEALKQGKKVYWHNSAYQVFQTPIREHYKEHDLNHETHLNGQMLEIICTSNYFGGLASLSELNACFIK